MKKAFSILMILVAFSAVGQESKYIVKTDLTQVNEDRLPIVISTPSLDADTVEYHLPKIVPGTYSISDFGRFVTDFLAMDAEGNELPVEQISTNKWKIASGGKIQKISYLINDTWDAMKGYESRDDNIVFEPGGTSIDAKEGLFMLNTFGLVGYIDGQKFLPYELSITHGDSLFGSTALRKEVVSGTEDIYFADDYNFLADGPIMYCVPDTITREVAGANILVSVFSPNKVLSAKDVMDNIYDLMEAQSKYLGGKLPVERYAYLINLFDEIPLSRASGALEHSYSSMYNLQESNSDRIAQTVRDVAAHEFLHIVTPLNIHSKEIGEFDYIEPKMSKHLWLYEGTTEYASMHVQVKYDLYDKETFLEEIKDKLNTADRFPNISFTEMSEKILEPEFEPMYSNVYYKGALIGLCLDLYITKYSDGEKNLQWLMRALAEKYGKSVSFEDDKLFEVITELTIPEVGEFLDTYVAGDEPLPIEEVLGWVGIDYQEEVVVQTITLGRFGLGLTEDRMLKVDDVSQINEFGENLGLMEGDIILEVQGQSFTIASAQGIMDNIRNNVNPGDKMIFLVAREKKGKLKKKKLKAKAMAVDAVEKHVLRFEEKPSKSELKLQKLWIGE